MTELIVFGCVAVVGIAGIAGMVIFAMATKQQNIVPGIPYCACDDDDGGEYREVPSAPVRPPEHVEN